MCFKSCHRSYSSKYKDRHNNKDHRLSSFSGLVNFPFSICKYDIMTKTLFYFEMCWGEVPQTSLAHIVSHIYLVRLYFPQVHHHLHSAALIPVRCIIWLRLYSGSGLCNVWFSCLKPIKLYTGLIKTILRTSKSVVTEISNKTSLDALWNRAKAMLSPLNKFRSGRSFI